MEKLWITPVDWGNLDSFPLGEITGINLYVAWGSLIKPIYGGS